MPVGKRNTSGTKSIIKYHTSNTAKKKVRFRFPRGGGAKKRTRKRRRSSRRR